jgi:hypothetical protein
MNKKTIVTIAVTALIVYMAHDQISMLPLVSKLPTV